MCLKLAIFLSTLLFSSLFKYFRKCLFSQESTRESPVNILHSTPKEKRIKLVESKTPSETGSKPELGIKHMLESNSPFGIRIELHESKTSNGVKDSRLSEPITPTGTKRKMLKTPSGSGGRLSEWKTPNGIKGRLSESNTPKWKGRQDHFYFNQKICCYLFRFLFATSA